MSLQNAPLAAPIDAPPARAETFPLMSEHSPDVVTTISSSTRARLLQSLRDLVEYRELFFAFVARDLKVRYKQTALGVAWVILQPLVTGVIFSAVFSAVAASKSGGWSTFIFFLAGLVPWTSFQNGVQLASVSMETNANLVSKVYFPRMVIPGGHMLASTVDFLIGFVVLAIAAAIAGAPVGMLLMLMPPLLVMQLVAGCGLSLFLAALNAQYRDVKYAVPFLLQTAMFVTVLVPLSQWRDRQLPFGGEILHGALYQILSLNPMAAVIESYRAALLGQPLDMTLLVKGVIVSMLLLAGGIRFFASREKRLVDIL
ncbi:ABC transporter permease [soil metagenome]